MVPNLRDGFNESMRIGEKGGMVGLLVSCEKTASSILKPSEEGVMKRETTERGGGGKQQTQM